MLMLKTIRSKYGAVVGALVLLMVFLLTVRDKVSRLYFFPRVTLLTFFSILVVWGLGFLGLGSCGVGPSGFFLGWGALYKHKRLTLGKKRCTRLCFAEILSEPRCSSSQRLTRLLTCSWKSRPDYHSCCTQCRRNGISHGSLRTKC